MKDETEEGLLCPKCRDRHPTDYDHCPYCGTELFDVTFPYRGTIYAHPADGADAVNANGDFMWVRRYGEWEHPVDEAIKRELYEVPIDIEVSEKPDGSYSVEIVEIDGKVVR